MKNFNHAISIVCSTLLLTWLFSSQCLAQSILDIKFDRKRGFYDTSFDLNVDIEGYNPIARYTTDGSDPYNSSTKISLSVQNSNVITIDKTTVIRVVAIDGLDTLRAAHTYLFLNDVLQQSNTNTIDVLDYPPIWGTGLTNTLDPDSPIGDPQYLVITQDADYEMDQTVVQDQNYAQNLIAGLKQIPTLSISTAKNNLFGSQDGIYTHTLDTGVWEVPASVELFNGDGTSEFQVEAGLKISGASTRKYDFYKHGFRLVFKNKYGDTKLRHQVFGPKAADEFNTLQLRMIGHSSPHDWDYGRRLKTQFHKDQWARNLHRKMGNLSPRSKFVHLYLNGLYWGMYDLTERPDSDFLSTYLGGNDTDYDTVKVLEIKDGDSLAYYKMFEIANSPIPDTIYNAWNYNLVPNETNVNIMYDSIVNYLDVNSFIDYFLLNALLVNNDWGANNWWAGRKREVGAGWQYFVWDAEFILNDSPVYTSRIFHGSDNFHPERYRKAFADRVQCHCIEEDGALYVDNLLSSYLELGNSIDKAGLLELARWGDVRGNLVDYNTHVVGETTKYMDEIIPDLFEGEKGLLFYLRYGENNYYPKVISAPKLSSFGGQVPFGYQLVIDNLNSFGDIYYTLDGSDPSTPGNPAKKLYTGPITINDYAIVSARAYVDTLTYGISNRDTLFNHWSAMCPRDFYTKGYYDHIVINEIHYNPADVGATNGGLFEFVELKNNGSTLVNLCNTFFNTGIEFDFPINTYIEPNGFVVLARDTTSFNNNYTVVADGEFKGKLSNGGEELILNKPDGNLIDKVVYDDYVPWDTIPDGLGESLSLDFVPDPSYNNDFYSSWRRSVGGPTPRKENVFCAPVSINEAIAAPSCYGYNDGFIYISPSGAGGPFTYLWSNGETGSGVSNLSGGTYFLDITDSQGCSTSKSVTIADPAPLISNLSVQPTSATGSADGTAVVNLNTAYSTYNVTWSNGVSGTHSISNLPEGSYSVTVDNGLGCIQTNSFEIQVGSPCPMPTNVIASASGESNIILSWDAEQFNNGTTIKWRKENDNLWNSTYSANAYLLLSGLQDCSNYEYEVYGVCPNGLTSNISPVNTVNTNCSQNVCNANNTNGYSHNSTPTSAFLVWDINPESTYELHYRKVGATDWYGYKTNFHFAILFNLNSCSDYEWYVDITCPNGLVSTSNPNTFKTTGCNKIATPQPPVSSKNKQSIALYPNPANNLLTVSLPKHFLLQNAYISIYHLNGELIRKTKVTNYDTILNISGLPKGLYLLKYNNHLHNETTRLQIF